MARRRSRGEGGQAIPAKVFLVGAGPGDPGLLTLKGRDCLGHADVVIYDALANPALLDHAPAAAERVYAGKRAGQHALSQPEINRLLVEYGQLGKTVVRLKGGDPFLFGRGSEEAEALRAAGVPFEVVPGVTSAIAVPAYAGIPVTHRGLASSVTFATAHEDPGKAITSLDWSALAGADTLVLLMSVGNLPEVVARLREAGRSDETPVALVRWGTTPEQESAEGTLGTIEAVLAARRSPFRPPAIIIVGEVVSLRSRLRWYDRDPLFGKRVLVTRSRERSSELSATLRAAGAIPLEVPALETEPIASAALDDTLRCLEQFDWAVFTSANGVRHTLQRLDLLGLPREVLAGRKIAVIGPATAREAAAAALSVAYRPGEYVAEALAAGLPAAGERVLLLLAEAARPVLREGLAARGIDVEQVAVYRTTAGEAEASRLREVIADGLDAATFASSLTVTNFAALAVEAGYASPAAALAGVVVACIGPVTARAAAEAGVPAPVVAKEHTVAALVEALRDHFAALGGEP